MRTCSVEGCARRHVARGYCKAHYDALHRTRDTSAVCSEEGCGRRRYRDGRCKGHWKRATGAVPAAQPLRKRPSGYAKMPAAGQVCRVGACGKPVKARGLCSVHYSRRLQTPGEWSYAVGTTPGACATLQQLTKGFFVQPHVMDAIRQEAADRHLAHVVVAREWLQEAWERRQAEARARTLEAFADARADNDDMGPAAPSGRYARNERIRAVLRREALTAEQVAERFGVSLDNAMQLMSRTRREAATS